MRFPDVLLSLFFSLISTLAFSQSNVLWLENNYLTPLESALYQKSNLTHPNIKPYIEADFAKNYVDSLDKKRDILTRFSKSEKKDTAQSSKKEFSINGYPLFQASASAEGGIRVPANTPLRSSIGFGLNSKSGTKFFAYYNYLSSYGKLPFFDYELASEKHIVNGESIGHVASSGEVHNRLFTAGISYNPNKHFQFLLAKGKNHLGDGYRSLLLSDQAPSYPFFRLAVSGHSLKYAWIVANLKDYRANTRYWDLPNKYMSVHYVSWNLTKRLNFSLYESVVWQGKDTLMNRNFEPNYLNPLVLYRPVEYSLGSADNSLMGASGSLRLFKGLVLYGQFFMDEFLLSEIKAQRGWWANKQALLAGLKYYDMFGLKGLFIQGEACYIRPFTYSHFSSLTAYGHLNQPLAHPDGANLTEILGRVRYQKSALSIELLGSYLMQGEDFNAKSYGSNVFISYTKRAAEYGNIVGQGLLTKTLRGKLSVNYILIPEMNLQAEAGLWLHAKKQPYYSHLGANVYLSIKTALFNSGGI